MTNENNGLGRLRRAFAWADVIFYLGFAAFLVVRADWKLRTWVGLILAVIGLALWMTARFELGSSFSVRAQAKTLVTTGLYARFRHPIYLFGLVAYVGAFLIWGRWSPFLCFLLVYTIEIARLRNEERVLEAAFGQEYLAYKAHTWF